MDSRASVCRIVRDGAVLNFDQTQARERKIPSVEPQRIGTVDATALTKGEIGRVVQSQSLGCLRRRFTVQEVADNFGQSAERAQEADHGSRSTDLDQVDLHKSVPGRRDLSLDDSRDGVRNVIDGKELVDQHPAQYVSWNALRLCRSNLRAACESTHSSTSTLLGSMANNSLAVATARASNPLAE